jgi:hypothetical protein
MWFPARHRRVAFLMSIKDADCDPTVGIIGRARKGAVVFLSMT